MTGTTDQPLDWGREPDMSGFETMTWRMEADTFAEFLRAGFDEILALGDGHGAAADQAAAIETTELI
ncbi:MAG TPA: hypothetical protein VIW24_27310 [Aldersonia sp.]